jgi:subtilisin family serine protease
LLAVALLSVVGVVASSTASRPVGAPVQVVVELASPPLAYAGVDPIGASTRIDAEQRAFREALRAALPEARTRWRYRMVMNGFSVVLPEQSLATLERLPGVRSVTTGGAYGAMLDRSRKEIGAAALRGAGLEGTGAGVKIGIIDTGLDQTHPFFDPRGYTMPPGFPKGQTSYTTAKVIVARSFPAPGFVTARARMPFEPGESDHGTHVAGIAAGNEGTSGPGGRVLSGVAPGAYIGNYKALTVPTAAGVGINGNAPELVAAIEAAVTDGMDVINVSIGEFEIEPSRDIVALALDAAAAAGVVPVVAAGNSADELGIGSVGSPANARDAITVAAATRAPDRSVAYFSSIGPAPVSLRLKPDVAAPGTSILSAVTGGGWGGSSGTSMASPHVAGAAALLLQRHPAWTPAQVKAAIVGTASPFTDPADALPTRAGSGFLDLVAADAPLIAAAPTSVSFGLVPPGSTLSLPVDVTDLGGGTGEWTVAVTAASAPVGTVVEASTATLQVPGTLDLVVRAGEELGEASGVVTLTRGATVRRIPYWLRVSAPALAATVSTPLTRPGVVSGNTRGRAARATVYRYPEVPEDGPVTARLAGPEQLFRVRIAKPVANFGVVILSRGRGVTVEPRVIVAGDESRLTGATALPVNANPYQETLGEPVLAAGAIRPLPGTYDLVFDSATPAGAGSFTFRWWVDDVTPPQAKLVTRSLASGARLRIHVSDAGSGIDPASIALSIDGRERGVTPRGGVISLPTTGLARGRHRLRLQLADYQETRNMENVLRILPNTRVLQTTFVIR